MVWTLFNGVVGIGAFFSRQYSVLFVIPNVPSKLRLTPENTHKSKRVCSLKWFYIYINAITVLLSWTTFENRRQLYCGVNGVLQLLWVLKAFRQPSPIRHLVCNLYYIFTSYINSLFITQAFRINLRGSHKNLTEFNTWHLKTL